ncbi:enoyl-CoA hydratase-related protein [Altererythrobacter sp. Z27]|uniref:enoyl-CoA hydratase-related protein n=1 Tax=Altererythrobacter sp. Z27 TaxID=3461147 RepID=UPI004044802B
MSRNEAVLFEIPAPHVALITINRPDVRNAINGAVALGLNEAVRRVDEDNDLRVAILTASGDKAFSAGADLAEVAAGRGRELSLPGSGFAGFVQAKRNKPWIAAVRGNALGGGLELCLACDFVVAAETAAFGLPEVKRGLFAGAGGVLRLPRTVPRPLALEMIATGEPLTATHAMAAGLVNHVVPLGDVNELAMTIANKIAANAPLAVTESLRIARASDDLDEAALWEMNMAAAKVIGRSEDAREGPRAFVEKRAPIWTGR